MAMSPRICVASHHDSLASVAADAEFLALGRDPNCLVELRLDRYRDASVEALKQLFACIPAARCVVTCRCAQETGDLAAKNQPLALREALWRAAVESGAAFIDIELRTLADTPALRPLVSQAERARVGVLISAHDFSGVPQLTELQALRHQAEVLGASLVKLVVQPARVDDCLPLLTLLQQKTSWRRPFLGLAMGQAGLWSRLLVARFAHPPPFTFARAHSAAGTAPGQPSWRTLRELYRFDAITAETPVYGVMGAPIGHSLSPLLHNRALQAQGLPGVYLPFLVEGAPDVFVREFAPRLGVCGLSVTLPHKEAVLALCHEVQALARQIGAANTLVALPEKAGWVGSNTDASAASASLAGALGRLQGRRIAIVGAGGAARAVAHGVHAAGAEVIICNRNPARAEVIATEVMGHVAKIDDLPTLGCHALVNTTPVGMAPHTHVTPVPSEALPPNVVVFDTIYNPAKTRLMREAEARGCQVLGGIDMFVRQAAAQFTLFTGAPAPQALLAQWVQHALINAPQ